MNCHTAQRRLLSLADATRVPASLRAHLIDCPTCQEWQRRVIQVDRHIPLLPVPPSTFAKARFLREVRTKPSLWRRAQDGLVQVVGQFRQRQNWQMTAAGLAAAAAVLFVVVHLTGPNPGMVVNPSRRNQPDPLLASLVQRSTALAEVRQPDRQAEILGHMAEDLRGQTERLAHSADTRSSQEVLARWYGKVVGEEVKRAQEVPAAERGRVLAPLALQLAQAAGEADQLADEISAGRTNDPLRSISRIARKAKRELDTLRDQRATLELRVPLLAPRLMAAGLVFAAAEPGPSAAEQALRFQRNERLIQSVVDGSLLLASESDPVKRADVCKQIAKVFAEEIQRAAVDHEGPRAAELSGYFSTVLERGVAFNLQSAGEKVPLVSMQNGPLLEIGAQVAQIAQPLEAELRRDGDPRTQTYLKQALTSVENGERQVREVLKDRAKEVRLHADPEKK